MTKTIAEKQAHKIYLEIHQGIVNLIDKFITGNYNEATMYAFQIGIESNIASVLRKVKSK